MAEQPQFDAVVVGAGIAGLYMLHRLRQQGMSAVVLESGDDVGGTWYWNRYPGARCDIPTTDYTYSFDPELEDAWTWSEKYATQPEILRYMQFVAERYDLRRDIRFSTRVEAATWDDAASLWRLRTSTGDDLTARWYVMATGCLSMPKTPDIEGAERFTGEVYNTSSWPHEGVDFTGKRVGVIGTGSSGIQSIPLIAAQASQLTVFQRTANFSVPAQNGPAPADRVAMLAEDRAAYRHAGKYSLAGVVIPRPEVPAGGYTPEQQRELLDAAWDAGELLRIGRRVRRPGLEPGEQRHHLRLRPRADPRHRRRPADRRGPVPQRSPDRLQAHLPRHELLRHLQPAARAPRQPAAHTDRHDHRDRAADHGGGVRVRRDRVRHRLRRDDRRARRRRHHRQ